MADNVTLNCVFNDAIGVFLVNIPHHFDNSHGSTHFLGKGFTP